jgi:phospholipase/carboxylesterase
MEQILTTFDSWTLRVRPGSGRKILLLLHGWTGNENSMSVFIKNFPADYWIVSPRALFPVSTGGFSWRAQAPNATWPTVDLFRPAVASLLELLKDWAAVNNIDAERVDVAGFSQGGALTFTLGALHPERFGKMGILAGFAPEGAESVVTPSTFLGKRVFVAHGTLDEMVPIELAKRTIQILTDAGAEVEYNESEVGHKLSMDGLRALEIYLAA